MNMPNVRISEKAFAMKYPSNQYITHTELVASYTARGGCTAQTMEEMTHTCQDLLSSKEKLNECMYLFFSNTNLHKVLNTDYNY